MFGTVFINFCLFNTTSNSYSVRSFESKGKGCMSNIRRACKLACKTVVEDKGGEKTVLNLLCPAASQELARRPRS